MKKQSIRRKGFAVCVDNTGYLASLEAGKLYAIVPDAEAAKHGLIRLIDESGEDYGYSVERFFVRAPRDRDHLFHAIVITHSTAS